MPQGTTKRSSLLDMTLTELAFIMLFLLLLFTAIQIKEFQESAIQPEEKKALIKVRERLEDIFKYDSKESQELINKLVNSFKTEWEREKALEELKILKEENETLKQYEKVVKELNNEDPEKAADILSYINDLEKKIESLDSESSAEKVIDHIKKALSDNKTLLGQNKYLLRKAKGNGLDHPPCWADQDGKPQYIYWMTILPGGIKTSAYDWPQNREDELKNIPGSKSIISETITPLKEFRKLAKPILDWSKKNKCRHFVRIIDGKTTKKEYKNSTFTIEHFFYKYEEK